MRTGAAANVDTVVAQAARGAGLPLTALTAALGAYHHAVAAGVARPGILTVIDYALPSHKPRLWVLDLAHGQVLARELVAHGRGSGNDVARRFSDRDGSHQSSLGAFVTGSTYQGRNGLSLVLRGLDPELNAHAVARGIVIHGAWYVSRAMIRRTGRLGRSWGCPALSLASAPRIIRLIAGGSLVYAYYPSLPSGGRSSERPPYADPAGATE